MLKKMLINKIIVAMTALFALFLIWLIPNNVETELKVKQELTYVDNEITNQDIFLVDKNGLLALTSVATPWSQKSTQRGGVGIGYAVQ